MPDEETRETPRVLLIDKDADVAEVVVAILTDEGYAVATLADTTHAAIAAAIGRDEPDCILLDGGVAEYGASWAEAAYVAARGRAIPTIMFTAHVDAVREARKSTSDRAVAADFAAVLPKPFALDELVEAVATACGRSEPFDRSPTGDRARDLALVEALKAAGADDVRTSTRREWATFRSKRDDHIYQLYWWQLLGVYMVGRYGKDARLAMVGQFFERDAAIAAALAE